MARLLITCCHVINLCHNDMINLSHDNNLNCHVLMPCGLNISEIFGKAMAATPKSVSKNLTSAMETKSRLQMCWKLDLNWELYPPVLKMVMSS